MQKADTDPKGFIRVGFYTATPAYISKPALQQVFRISKLGLAHPPINTLGNPSGSPAHPASHTMITHGASLKFPRLGEGFLLGE
jgi:hypothetical protein